MEISDIVIANLRRKNVYGPKDFKIGERVRIYIEYWGYEGFREGIVLDPEYQKKHTWGKTDALRLAVKKSGWINMHDRKGGPIPESYTRPFIYSNIGFVEKFEEGKWIEYPGE